jgi:hypothetical protein
MLPSLSKALIVTSIASQTPAVVGDNSIQK